MHTSTVTVAIIDPDIAVSEKYTQISDKDFRIEWFSGTGAGGQHRNKCQNSCRVHHIPTGISEARQGRERNSNLKSAKEAILVTLEKAARNEKGATLSEDRKEQAGSGARGDKTVTIAFQRNIATHVNGKQMSATSYMKGNMDMLWR